VWQSGLTGPLPNGRKGGTGTYHPDAAN
jgi:hypothetical protein